MPNFGQFPQTATLLGLQTVGASGTSGVLTLPSASSYRIITQVQTVSGTSPTLQVILATSLDNGATYNEVLSFANLTTTGQGRQMLFRPYLNPGDVATNAATALLGTADLAAGDLIANGPINPSLIKVRWVVGGTSPSFAFQVQYAAVPQDLSD